MKNTYLLFLLIPFLGLSQKQTSIEVVGRSIHYDKTPLFKGDITLSTNFSSYPKDAISFKEMKLRYDEALKIHGLSLNKMTEDTMGYAQLYYEKEGTLYTYKTTSVKDFQAFLSTKSFGLQSLYFGYEFTIDAQEAAFLLEEALKNAREQALIVASEIGKKVGKVISVEDKNPINTVLKKSMYYDHEIGKYPYDITVVFELEE